MLKLIFCCFFLTPLIMNDWIMANMISILILIFLSMM